jgi:predicted negative regulator of RcsB-dependent stress response
VSYETEEQQVEALKDWWKENGTPLVVGAILGLAGFGGWKYWNQQQITYQENASDLFSKVTEILKTEDKKGLAESAQAVKENYPDSSYAILAALQLAKLSVDANELDKAATELNWVVTNHASNELAIAAKIRLARIFIQQEKAAEALALVTLEEDSGYYALASLVKGDALLALGKNEEALTAYKAASLDLAIAARHPSLQLKIDELSTGSLIASNEKEAPASVENTSQPKVEEETPVMEEEPTSEGS